VDGQQSLRDVELVAQELTNAVRQGRVDVKLEQALRHELRAFQKLADARAIELRDARLAIDDLKFQLRNETRKTNTSSGFRATGTHLSWGVRILIAVGVALTAFGVLQPLILWKLGLPHAANSNTVDMIAVLVTVVALFTGSVGIAIYNVVLKESMQSLNRVAQEYSGNVSADFNASQAMTRANEGYGLWRSIEPALIDPPSSGSWEEALRNIGISYAVSVARSGLIRAEATQEGDQKRSAVELARRNLSFCLACQYRYVKPASIRDAGDALSLLPSGSDVGKENKLSWSARETVAWVKLCCLDRNDPEWATSAVDAKRLYSSLPPGEADAMRLRYRHALGIDVSDPTTVPA
jgi:hypothetical protein